MAARSLEDENCYFCGRQEVACVQMMVQKDPDASVNHSCGVGITKLTMLCGGSWKRDYGELYTGTKEETPDTDKGPSSGLPRQSSTLPPLVFCKRSKEGL